jgi:hypothetical protein
MSLDTPLTIWRFETLAKTESARLEGDCVVGTFAPASRLVLRSIVTICETFANYADDEKSILRFTKRYAPLHLAAAPGEPFRFALSEWRRYQTSFQWLWRKSTPATLPDSKELGVPGWNDVGRLVPLQGGELP